MEIKKIIQRTQEFHHQSFPAAGLGRLQGLKDARALDRAQCAEMDPFGGCPTFLGFREAHSSPRPCIPLG